MATDHQRPGWLTKHERSEVGGLDTRSVFWNSQGDDDREDVMDEQVTLTDEEIETRPLGTAPRASAMTADTGDDTGDVSDTSDTGDDSGDVSDTSDTGDDSGDDSGDDAAA